MDDVLSTRVQRGTDRSIPPALRTTCTCVYTAGLGVHSHRGQGVRGGGWGGEGGRVKVDGVLSARVICNRPKSTSLRLPAILAPSGLVARYFLLYYVIAASLS